MSDICEVCRRPLGDTWASECGPTTEDEHFRLGYEIQRVALANANARIALLEESMRNIAEAMSWRRMIPGP